MGLLDREKRLFLIGDQLLNRTAPIVGTSHVDEHLLREYFASLETLEQAYADHCLMPAHEGVITDVAACVQHTRQAYQRKIDLARECLSDEPQTAWEVAKRIYGLTPDKRSDTAFYNAKMMNSKTFSILEYLRDCGEALREDQDGMLLWTRK